MKKMTLLIAVFSLICLGANASADETEWKYYASTKIFDYYYNPTTVKQLTKDVVSVAGKQVIKDAESREQYLKDLEKLKIPVSAEEYKSFKETVSFLDIDCSSRKYRIVSMVDYDDKGKAISTAKGEGMKWEAIVQHSITDVLQREVCTKKAGNK